MSMRKHLLWLMRAAAATLACMALSALAYFLVPPHAEVLASVRAQCRPLPHDAYAACAAPAVRAALAWTGRCAIVVIVLAAALTALHPWWLRRRGGLVPLDGDTALERELAGLAGPGRQPAWLLAPYAYTDRGRAFGVPWRPCVRIDIGLGILFRADRSRFRAAVSRELDRLDDRAAGARHFAAGSLLMLAVAVPAAVPTHQHSALDPCLVGYWTEAPRSEAVLLGGSTVTWVEHHGAIWSFTRDGTAVLHPGAEKIRSTVYAATGTIHWRASTHGGRIELSRPAVTAAFTASDGTTRTPGADEFTLPGPYTCGSNTTTSPGELNVVVLHRIGGPSRSAGAAGDRPAGHQDR